jgi:RNA polymerase sigma-70 factor (ECF subfamily)
MTRAEDCDDRVLIERTLAGETDCFSVLMKRHVNSLRRQINPMLRNSADKDDVIQDVMLKVWRRLSSFRGESSFRTWMGRVAINEALMNYRKARTRPSCDADLSTLKSTAESPLQAVVRRETTRRVRGAAARLPPQYRRVLILRDIEELNLRETADSMGLSVPAVKSRLFRARLRLSAALRSEPGAADWRAA